MAATVEGNHMKPLLFRGVAMMNTWLRWQSLVDEWNIPYLGRDLRDHQALGIAMVVVGTPTT